MNKSDEPGAKGRINIGAVKSLRVDVLTRNRLV